MTAAGSLNPEGREKLRWLQDRDAEVRRHEGAHLAAAGGFAASGPHYELQEGPDGQHYAIGGHVNVDTSSVPDDPEAALNKARTIRQAALAPDSPSSQDQAVAEHASMLEAKAERDLSRKQSQGQTPQGADGCNCPKHFSTVSVMA